MKTLAAPRQGLPGPGLSRSDFQCMVTRGFGDADNSYPHSMVWFRDRLYVGTTRSNLCMMKVFRKQRYNILDTAWPIECPDDIYQMDRRAQIWCHDPAKDEWRETFRSPMVEGLENEIVPREIGYRAMCVFQGESDPEPMLYAATTSPGRGLGALILRSADGQHFEPVSRYGILGLPVTTVRTLVSFKGRLFTAPTGTRGGNVNYGMIPIVYESRDPLNGNWTEASTSGFGDPGNQSIFELEAFGDYLYAGTFNLAGYQIWRSKLEGNPPYQWECVLRDGAGRGPLNQSVASMYAFKNALYVGSGIQGGGYDNVNNVGPDAAELIRVHPNGEWDLLIGSPRIGIDGAKRPLSGLGPGFGHLLNGYFWRMAEHDGWLYLGTYDASVMLRWILSTKATALGKMFAERIGTERLIEQHGGFDLWRSYDGENWLPVDHQGFGTPYNFGLRTMVSTPYGFYVGTANPFGPKVAEQGEDGWHYVDNPRGGLEIWRGQHGLEVSPKAAT